MMTSEGLNRKSPDLILPHQVKTPLNILFLNLRKIFCMDLLANPFQEGVIFQDQTLLEENRGGVQVSKQNIKK